MPSIQLSPEDTNLMWNFALRSLSKMNEKVLRWSVEDQQKEVAGLFGYTESTIKNLFVLKPSRIKLPQSRFEVFCKEIELILDSSDDMWVGYQQWKSRIKKLYLNKPEDNKAANAEASSEYKKVTVSLIRSDGTRILPESVIPALEILSNYYIEEVKKHKYIDERKVFEELKQLLIQRATAESKEIAILKTHREGFVYNLLQKDGWEWYEKSNDKIIKKNVLFVGDDMHNNHDSALWQTFKMYSFIKGKPAEEPACSVEINITHECLLVKNIITHTQTKHLECSNFYVSIFENSDLYIGHKVTIDLASGEMKAVLVVLRKCEQKARKEREKEYELNSTDIPLYVRTVLCSPREVKIRINPFRGLRFTINKLEDHVPAEFTFYQTERGTEFGVTRKKI